MNNYQKIFILVVGLTMALASGARADADEVCTAYFNVSGYPNLSGLYVLSRSYTSKTAVLSQNGALYQLTCETVGPMGESSCEEKVHVGYNPQTGGYDGAFSFSTSDTGEIYLGVSYGPNFFVKVGTFVSKDCKF